MSTDIHIAKSKAHAWLASEIDRGTRIETERLLGSETELLEAFLNDLDFGTGGLRGVMGVGTSRINKYTIGIATQGLANYLKQQFSGKEISVAIAYDSRNNSQFFAETAAGVLSANGIVVHLFPELRPTPLLSFAVRQLKCNAGIVITASHNPREYNGYKVYWDDGAQVVSPHDTGIINEVRAIKEIGDVKFEPNRTPASGTGRLIREIDSSVEEAYLEKLSSIILLPDAIEKCSDLKIVYTPIHGSGITMVPKALAQAGFTDVMVVDEQSQPDGNFPTVKSPNPEENEAMSLALELGEKENSDIVLGTDPDADRVGLAVRNEMGKLILLNGNQTGSLIAYYQLSRWKELGKLNGKQFIAKTIVTSDLISDIAKSFGVKVYETLTGFKYIAEVLREKEGQEEFICGGEESYGYMIGDFVRDKDAVISSVVIAEIAAWAKSNGKTLYQLLNEIYLNYGLYHEDLYSITMKGLDGLQKIRNMMKDLRESPPESLGRLPVKFIHDFELQQSRNLLTGEIFPIALPKSNVLQFEMENGSKVTARPSGTEPKIKFYFSLKEKLSDASDYHLQMMRMITRIIHIKDDLGI